MEMSDYYEFLRFEESKVMKQLESLNFKFNLETESIYLIIENLITRIADLKFANEK